jgi:hypothetical protein
MSIYSSIHVTACLPAFSCICMFVSVCVCLYLYLSPLESGSSLTQNYLTSLKKTSQEQTRMNILPQCQRQVEKVL